MSKGPSSKDFEAKREVPDFGNGRIIGVTPFVRM
jgi:hypothetical protein